MVIVYYIKMIDLASSSFYLDPCTLIIHILMDGPTGLFASHHTSYINRPRYNANNQPWYDIVQFVHHGNHRYIIIYNIMVYTIVYV